MKKIALHARIFLTAAIICAAAFAAALAAALAFRFSHWGYCAVFSLMGGTLTGAFFYTTRKKLTTAKAIADSAVIRIHPAVIYGQAEEGKEEGKEDEKFRENFGIYISCFGILLGTKIIKFNQDGIWLKNVEIGRDYISFGYGANGESIQNIKLLYPMPGGDELAGIIENFRKETGVVPTIAR